MAGVERGPESTARKSGAQQSCTPYATEARAMTCRHILFAAETLPKTSQKQTKSIKPCFSKLGLSKLKMGFSAGLAVLLVLSMSAPEIYAAETHPAGFRARVVPAPRTTRTGAGVRVCERPTGPRAVVAASREIAQVAGVPATTRRQTSTASTAISAASAGRTETPVASEGVVLAATSSARKASGRDKACRGSISAYTRIGEITPTETRTEPP